MIFWTASADLVSRPRASWRPLLELTSVLVGPLPFVPAPHLLTDTATDPGLFGPGSVTWRVAREPLLLLGSGRALLMQVAHPLVGQAVVDHSDYRSDPYGRMLRTVRWLVLVTFGTKREALAAAAEVARLHGRVVGSLPAENATVAYPAATGYSASDPELGRWVHATVVDSMLVAHDALVGSLGDHDRDRFVREWNSVAALMGITAAAHFDGERDLRAYVAAEIARGAVAPTAASRAASLSVLRPPLPTRGLVPAVALAGHVSVGLLPAELRDGLGIAWGEHRDRAHRAVCASFRRGRRLLPRGMRISPLHDWAVARAQGRLAGRVRGRDARRSRR